MDSALPHSPPLSPLVSRLLPRHLPRLGPRVAGIAAAAALSIIISASGASTAAQAVDAKPSPTPIGSGAVLSGYRLGPGDRIRLIVYGEPSLTGDFGVDGSGYLGIPLIGKVRGGGATAAELERRIAGRLSPDFIKNPSVTVEIATYRPFYIVGEVKQPGSYPYVTGMTVINAVALSGGFTYRARESRFRIKRRHGDATEGITALPETAVLPGDVITVDERFF